jgi:hypothetical protein
MFSWRNFFGEHAAPPDRPLRTANRLVAIGCALRIAADSPGRNGAFTASDITEPAEKFEEWLDEGPDEQDAQLRRTLLLLICDQAEKSTPASQIRALAKELHRHTTRR